MGELVVYEELPYVSGEMPASDAACALESHLGELERAVTSGEILAARQANPFPLSTFTYAEILRFYNHRAEERAYAASLPEEPDRVGEQECRPNEMYLYVIEIVGQCVKIGITKNMTQRLIQHRGAAKAHGREIGQVWVSCPHINARANETRLKGNSRSEYLNSPFDKVRRRAWSLPFIRVEV